MEIINVSQEEFNQQMEYAKMLREFGKINLYKYRRDEESIVKSFTKKQLESYMKTMNTLSSQKKIRQISRSLYFTSPQYRALINYYSTLYKFDYVVEGYDVNPNKITSKDKYREAYYNAVNAIEKMKIKQNSMDIRLNLYVDGVYFGYVVESKDGFYIKKIDPDYCKISFVNVETGQLGYSFNFAYFNGKEEYLDSFPSQFREIYEEIKRTKGKSWQRIESDLAFCLKATNSDQYPIPPLVGLFEGILDISDFKALNKAKDEISVNKILFQKIPMRTDKEGKRDEFLISGGLAKEFHDNINSVVPDQVTTITSPMDIEAIDFERDSVDINQVTEATSQFWSDSSAPQLLFDNNETSTALKYSVIADEASLSQFVEDFEVWLNEYLKISLKGKHKFKVRILPTTKFNQTEMLNSRLELATYGFPVKNEIMAIIGMNPSAAYANTFLENEILGLPDKLIPLSSSHTMSGTNDGGRPTVSDENLTDAGVNNRENNTDVQ